VRREDQREVYRRWWVGKMCKPVNRGGPFKKVVDVRVIGPPSFVYGSAYLVYEDGTEDCIYTDAFRPRKSDVKAKE